VNFHRVALLRHNVVDGFLDIFILPQPARAAVARPTLSIRLIDPESAEIVLEGDKGFGVFPRDDLECASETVW
jgi:hypothetical protein